MVEPRKSQAEHARLFMEETQQRIKKSQGERLNVFPSTWTSRTS